MIIFALDNLVLQREKDARNRLHSIEKEALILRQENADLKKDSKDGRYNWLRGCMIYARACIIQYRY